MSEARLSVHWLDVDRRGADLLLCLRSLEILCLELGTEAQD